MRNPSRPAGLSSLAKRPIGRPLTVVDPAGALTKLKGLRKGESASLASSHREVELWGEKCGQKDLMKLKNLHAVIRLRTKVAWRASPLPEGGKKF